MENFRSELFLLKLDRTREQRIAATWQVMAHELLNKKTFNIFRYLGFRQCWRYLRLCYYIELAVSMPEDFDFDPSNFERETFRQSDEVIRATTCLVSESGAGLPFCGIDHAHAFSKAYDQSGTYRLGQTSSKIKYCSHCVMCGAIIRRPLECMIHSGEDSDECPDVDVYGTLFSGDLIRHWQNLTKNLPYAEDIQAMNLLADANPELTAYEIVIVHWNLINPNP